MRYSGILMPIFSLPSQFPIGSLGDSAYKFIDFLKSANQKYWQLLPVGHTGFGDSPYQTFSAFAGNPYFIDLELLYLKGLLSKAELEEEKKSSDTYIDYGKLYTDRYKTLRRAFSRFKAEDGYFKFCAAEADWLGQYCLFMAIKEKLGGIPLQAWPKELKQNSEMRERIIAEQSENIDFYKFLQYEFFEQFSRLKSYAHKNGVELIGDIPIYVSLDSADVFSAPEDYLLDENLCPTVVAGCPPDSFSREGQLWGNPIYDWVKLKENGYANWKKKIAHNLKLFDILRIDHFRAFAGYYAIPAAAESARFGHWEAGVGMDFFNSLKADLGENLPIIAEDLGHLTPDVHKLLDSTGFRGMKVLQFAFDSREESDYLPHNYTQKCVVYTGTHDNATTAQWCDELSSDDLKKACDYLRTTKAGLPEAMLCAALSSVADICIIPLPDILRLGKTARINTPSTVGKNWRWRLPDNTDLKKYAAFLKEKTELYGRNR